MKPNTITVIIIVLVVFYLLLGIGDAFKVCGYNADFISSIARLITCLAGGYMTQRLFSKKGEDK
jgi:hypothetical protein